jgi:hypothetical protein
MYACARVMDVKKRNAPRYRNTGGLEYMCMYVRACFVRVENRVSHHQVSRGDLRDLEYMRTCVRTHVMNVENSNGPDVSDLGYMCMQTCFYMHGYKFGIHVCMQTCLRCMHTEDSSKYNTCCVCTYFLVCVYMYSCMYAYIYIYMIQPCTIELPVRVWLARMCVYA